MRNPIKATHLAALMAAVFGLGLSFTAQSADVVLKASHQFPGGKGDARDEMVQIIAREVEKANVGLKIQVYPGESLFKAKEQWGAITKGQLDLTALPLDYASGRHPQFSATLMPGLVKNHEHAQRLNKSPFMADIKKIIEDAGAMVLADAWLAGGFASRKNCILNPADVKGQVIRGAGPAFEQMLAGAGASISAMASSEIYTGLQTGVLDATNTSSGSFVSFRIYELVKCYTAPGDYALWFMYEPVLISKKTWDKLNKAQQDALRAAARKSEDYFTGESKKLDTKSVEVFKKANVQVVSMNAENFAAWKKLADQTSYKNFAEKVPGGKQLLDKALAVQ
jgi:TRAP-type C4-dicarboxylate transport system substrate-binding protein